MTTKTATTITVNGTQFRVEITAPGQYGDGSRDAAIYAGDKFLGGITLTSDGAGKWSDSEDQGLPMVCEAAEAIGIDLEPADLVGALADALLAPAGSITATITARGADTTLNSDYVDPALLATAVDATISVDGTPIGSVTLCGAPLDVWGDEENWADDDIIAWLSTQDQFAANYLVEVVRAAVR